MMPRLICLSGFVLVLAASASSAQQRLLDPRALSSGVVAEHWSFGDPRPGGGAASVVNASQFTVPVTAVVPIVPTWALDTYIAYTHGTVTLDRGGSVGRQQLSLSGVNDAKVRLVGKLHGDGVLLTLGASLPSGTTALEPSALEALSVLSAPALRFRTPTLGSGPSGTAGPGPLPQHDASRALAAVPLGPGGTPDAGIPARSAMTEDERAKALAKDDERATAHGRLI